MEYNKQIEILKNIAIDFKKENGVLYYVGGFVRDKLLGNTSKDIDVEIHNISFKKSKKILSKYGIIDLVGESFGVIKIHGLDIDFAFPRKETSTGIGHKDFEIYIDPFISNKIACKRRDFTINSIMQNVLSGEIIDNYNGISDLKNKIIRHVDSNSFIEDPLRVLRACQFSSRLNFEIHKSTIELCRTIDITKLSKERIYEEIKKALLKSKTPSLFIKQLIKLKKFEDVFFVDKNNSLNTDKIDILFNILDKGCSQKNYSNNPELFMMSCLVFGLSTCIINFDIQKLLKKISYKKELNNSVIKLLENNNSLCNLQVDDLYGLKIISISSYKKLFNIDDVILFNKISNFNYNNIMKENLEKINLNPNRTITPIISGKILKELEIEPLTDYKNILEKCLDLQLQDNSIEFFKYLLELVLMQSSTPSKFFDFLKEKNLLEKYIPELLLLDNTKQNPLYHPEGSVYNHTMNVINISAKNREFAYNKYEFMFSALCHDFGKISTTFTKADGKIVSYGHENQLQESKTFLERFNINSKSKEIIVTLQKNHMRPFMLYKQNSKLSAVKRLQKDVGDYFKDLLLLSYCDKSGSGNKSKERLEDLKNYKKWFENNINKIY